MLISIDHGNYAIKTVNHTFVSGLVEHTVKPPMTEDIMEYKGSYWTLSGKRLNYMKDKTQDERFFILSLFAIAKELESSGLYSPIENIDLAVGLPPEHYGVLKEKFADYFRRTETIKFTYKDKPYNVIINNVMVFPQAYAAVVPHSSLVMNELRVFIVDIGGYTTDVLLLRNGKENDWFFDNVRYVNENGLMSGMTNTEFAPSDTLTRGMLVTILYRLAGEPVVNKSIPFADVTSDSYYANAVIWAEQNGIVSGINETEFAPDENITREQIAVILYRYAKAVGYDVSVGEDTNILSYDDFEEISEYAIEAVQYAVGSGLMNGKTEKTLNPKDFATRAEIATILNRFIEGNK